MVSDKPQTTVEAFRAQVEEAIIREINDPRNAGMTADFRDGLRVARAILNSQAQALGAYDPTLTTQWLQIDGHTPDDSDQQYANDRAWCSVAAFTPEGWLRVRLKAPDCKSGNGA